MSVFSKVISNGQDTLFIRGMTQNDPGGDKLMNLIDGLLTLTVIHFIATVSPGPEFMLISKEALTRGRKAGFICVAGTLSGLSIHILYSAFGLAAVISNSPKALLLIQLVGGGYLIYLGVTAMMAKPSQTSSDTLTKRGDVSGLQIFRAGFICDLLNPKAPIYYVSLFTFILSPTMPAADIFIYGAWIMVIHLAWFSLVVLLLSTPAINRKFRSMSHWVDRILGGAMVTIGIKVITA
ncbi:MAG: LysE family translocator [Amphritea sp.]